MKNLSKLLAMLFIVAIVSSCDKSDEGEPKVTEVKDAKSLSAALAIEGATRKSGDIPFPGGTQYGKNMNLQTSAVIITPNSDFEFVTEIEDNAGILFLKLDGTDEYFQIPYNGSSLGRSAGSPMYVICAPSIKLNAKPMIPESFTASATVQAFTMPLQSNQTVDFSDLQRWTPPKRVTFRVVPTGTGDITITLTWDKDNSDVDLWLEEPNGNIIKWDNTRSSTGGYLDYDNVIGYGPENIFYEDGSSPLRGNYNVKVQYYSGAYYTGPVNWSVVVQNGSNVQTYRGTLVNNKEVDAVMSFSK